MQREGEGGERVRTGLVECRGEPEGVIGNRVGVLDACVKRGLKVRTRPQAQSELIKKKTEKKKAFNCPTTVSLGVDRNHRGELQQQRWPRRGMRRRKTTLVFSSECPRPCLADHLLPLSSASLAPCALPALVGALHRRTQRHNSALCNPLQVHEERHAWRSVRSERQGQG